MTSPAGDAALARALAEEAGEVLLRIRDSALAGRDLAQAGDSGANELLLRRLAQERPGDLVLSEEAADPQARVDAARVWIVDPLDGTREFTERPRADWAVHVALWEGGRLVAGAVALPAEGVTYGSDMPITVPDRAPGPIRVAVSRTRPPTIIAELVERLGVVTVPMGSAGVKCASVWRGQADAYVHAGGQYEWDSAAPVAVAGAAGLFTSRLDGGPLIYNRPDPLLPDLLVCRPELAPLILEVTSR